ncbi:type IV pili methyl-accepting chemotaxis transducer N-terminal domain-containing protein [Propionivibrio soli]|uniref:type IV pili methyl-accepting chemotaxis transducer N-terminal domain-containing protein n=1 Tax=Propionivibrio soli TaxID=2976531 RepID=UPI0021E87926|nr:type IV pili methyl-accepting chemotaxis transducer N-terminal domain-containing protein [Propionivibrio soli]
MTTRKQWSLGAKLALLGAPFLLLVLLSTAAALWVSWQLDGGAAAVNEAGRMRMQAYRMSLSVGLGRFAQLPDQVAEFELSLATLRKGDPERPLFVPPEAGVRERLETVGRAWTAYRARWLTERPTDAAALPAETAQFVTHIDAFVAGIEAHMARWTAWLYLLQLSVLGLAIFVVAILVYAGYVFVLEPVTQLRQAVERIQQGDFDARVDHASSDEFGTLARGFNGMAEHLQHMYRHLEHKVAEKTSELEEKKERLEGLYEVTALVAEATSLDELAQRFARNVMRIARADGITVRWSDQENQRYLMLAAQGMPQSLVDKERCIEKGDCLCGTSNASEIDASLRVIPIVARDANEPAPLPCSTAGFRTVVNVPVRLHDRLMGEVDLFFNAKITPTPASRSLLEALASHLAGAMENLRLNALEKEAAVAQERVYLARELHDSIAQSLAFIKIQVQLMRDALQSGNPEEMRQIVDEIDTGVRESYGDVRELLLHFRTRTNEEDVAPALATTLRKFELQSGIKAELAMEGHGLPLAPDQQIQVLHIVQEALSNVRKHAHASRVAVRVQQQPAWRFEVRDDGIGFSAADGSADETHVGLRIMKERAQRLGAEVTVVSIPGQGTVVTLTLPPPANPLAQATGTYGGSAA